MNWKSTVSPIFFSFLPCWLIYLLILILYVFDGFFYLFFDFDFQWVKKTFSEKAWDYRAPSVKNWVKWLLESFWNHTEPQEHVKDYFNENFWCQKFCSPCNIVFILRKKYERAPNPFRSSFPSEQFDSLNWLWAFPVRKLELCEQEFKRVYNILKM